MTELIVALDAKLENHTIFDLVFSGIKWFKIGVPMLLEPERLQDTISFIKYGTNAKIMLDLKLYDTRDTVLRTVDAAVDMGVSMMTVHIDSTIHLADEDRVKILAVRRLTDGTSCHHELSPILNVNGHGIICSVWDAARLRRHTRKLLVCPGIRPIGSQGDNHITPATPSDAAKFGADFIVVGRPIINAPDPVEAAKEILRSII